MPTMYTIGRFASIGRVSVRMLRHYDEIGLLVPAKVDAQSGYRSYAPGQLVDLADIMRLRGLGLGLADTAAVLRAGADDPAARELLEGAREALRRSLVADTDRLARFDAYLRRPEGAPLMSGSTTTVAVDYRAVPARRVATLTRGAAVTTHRGSVDGIAASWLALADAVRATGAVLSDACREVYLTPGDRPQSEWVTELVQPIASAP
jgi:DNA-binding transcriptional MerR regulator